MLLCGWSRRKNKQSTSQDHSDLSASIEEEKNVTETSIPDDITATATESTAQQNSSTSM